MLHVYEFEVFKDGDFYLAFPFDMDGGTQGRSIKEVSEMAANWLQIEMEHRAMHDIPFSEATFGNEVKRGGERLLVAVNADKSTVPRMTAAEAARRLGVTRARKSNGKRQSTGNVRDRWSHMGHREFCERASYREAESGSPEKRSHVCIEIIRSFRKAVRVVVMRHIVA